MFLTYALFVLGFVILIKGADMLVDGASSLARRLNVSRLVIGLTIVALGTSLPELMVNLFASVRGNTDIAIGNIIGSNIANIFLILGISAIIFPLVVERTTVWKGIPFSLLAAVMLGVLANDELIDGGIRSVLTRIDGFVLLSFFIIFLYYTVSIARAHKEKPVVTIEAQSVPLSLGFIIVGLAGLGIGGKWIVDGAIQIAQTFGASEALIGLTIIALGTSLPELATSAVAAYKKNPDIAVGNIVGSNIFNIFFILGVSAFIRPLPFRLSMNLDIGMTILASMLLFAALFIGKRQVMERWQGVFFVLLYVGYVAFLVVRG